MAKAFMAINLAPSAHYSVSLAIVGGALPVLGNNLYHAPRNFLACAGCATSWRSIVALGLHRTAAALLVCVLAGRILLSSSRMWIPRTSQQDLV